MFENSPHLYPEKEFWVLHNKFTNTDHIVQYTQIEEQFTERQIHRMLNNHDDYWLLYKRDV